MATRTWSGGLAAALTLVVCAPASAAWTPPAPLDGPVRTDDPSVGLQFDPQNRAVATTLLARGGPGCRGRCGGRVATEGAGARTIPGLAAPLAPLEGGRALFLRERAAARSRAELSVGVGSFDRPPARFAALERYDAWQFATRARVATSPGGTAVIAWIAERRLRGGPLRVVVRRPGESFRRRVTLSRRAVNAVAVAFGARGDVLVAYQRAGRVSIRVRRRGRTHFGSPQDLGPGGSGAAAVLTTAVDRSGRLAVAWTASRAGSERAVLRVALVQAGRAHPTVEVSDNALALDRPRLALGTDGTVGVAWNAPPTGQFAAPTARLSVAVGAAGPFQAQDVPEGNAFALAADRNGAMVAVIGGSALLKPAGTTRFGPPEQVVAGAVGAAARYTPGGTPVVVWRTPDGALQLSRGS